MNDQLNIFNHYPGGKNVNGTYHKIINLIPPHDVYIEACVGGGAIVRHKRLASITVVNDVDSKVYFAWVDYCAENDLEFEIKSMDVIDLIDWARYAFPSKRVFMYIDPPYPMESRKSDRPIYTFESSPELHKCLVISIDEVEFYCMISTYPNEFYSDRLGSSWNLVEFESQTRKGMATEWLFMNYPEPTELHDYQYLGEDCWDRQRIKRKIEGKVKQLSKLSILEQRAIVQALNNSMATTSKNNCNG